MTYKLIALDMDGTALTRKKELTPRTVAAMSKAIEQGKQVMFCTGRSLSLIRPYLDMVPGMRYAITAAGGVVVDLKTNEKLVYKTIDPETVKHIIAAANGKYVFPILFRDLETYGSSWCVDCADDFGFGAFEPIYRSCMHMVPDAMDLYMENPGPLEKFNLFFGNVYEAPEVYEQIKNLPVSFTTANSRAIEINALGVNKAEGLRAVCDRLGIDISECIAVGDAENDEELLSCAGLKVAMGNATERVKGIADVVTDDCDNDGVAKVIEQYFLA